MRCSWPRSAAARRAICRRPGSSRWIEFAHEFIEKSAIAWFKAYLDKVKSGEIEHVERGDAEIRQGALTAAA